jgi:RNA polymerase-binding transcription factor DksA
VAVKKVASKVASKLKKTSGKSASAKNPPAKKAPAKKALVKKVSAKKQPPKKAIGRSPNIVKPQLAKKKVVGKPFPAKLQTTTKGNSTTISVAQKEVSINEVVVEEKRLMMPPPPRPIINKNGKKIASLKPIKAAPAPLVMSDSENWTATELKSRRSELSKDLVRLKAELAAVEVEMDDLISASGVGAGDDLGDAGTKTFEREHEMSIVYNARDMVLQTERAIERIDNKTYGKCEECGNSIGKARLQVFPRATLCMVCKQKEERR